MGGDDNVTAPNADWGSGGSGAELGSGMVNLCGLFALMATLISLMAMFTHLKSYTKPDSRVCPILVD
ncbi:hypothetical protein L0F63_005191 [Massospora cicadina]|nr:hypothetical protein L0F63_005191 [Massospora cicadina]